MEKQTAIEKAGSVTELAKLLGIKREAIYQWKDKIPQAREWQLKILRPKWFRVTKE